MRRLGTYVVVALIAMALGAFASYQYNSTLVPDIITEFDTITVKEVDSTRIKYLEEELAKEKKNIKKEQVKIKVPVPVVKHDTVYVDSVEVATNKYTGSEELDNGTVHFEIYADSLLAYNFKLETEKEYVTETITKTIPPRNVFMVGGGFNYNGGLSAAEMGLMYNVKQKWQIGLVVQHDLTGLLPSQAQTSIGVRAYFKL